MQIIWFRRDLRITDNEIVSKACKDGKEVLPCFIIDPWFYERSELATLRVKFLLESLENLDTNLRNLGSKLYLFEGKSVAIIRELTRSLIELGKQPALCFNRDVQVEYGINRDRSILKFYRENNLENHIGLNHFLQKKENYDSLWRDYHHYQKQPRHSTPNYINTPELNLDLPQLTFTELWHKYCPNQKNKSSYFKGGEDEARKTLDSFLNSRYRGRQYCYKSLAVASSSWYY